MTTPLVGVYFFLQRLLIRPYSNYKQHHFGHRNRLAYNLHHTPRLTLSKNLGALPQSVGIPLENGLLYISSIVGRNGYSEFPTTFYQQAQFALLYLSQILHRSQSSPDYLLKVNVQITDLINLQDFLELFDQIFSSNNTFSINTHTIDNPFNLSLNDITMPSIDDDAEQHHHDPNVDQFFPTSASFDILSTQTTALPSHQNKPRPALNIIVVDGFFHQDCLIQLDGIACSKMISDPTISIDTNNAPFYLNKETELKSFREYSLQRWEHVFDSEILEELEKEDLKTSVHPAIHHARLQIRLELEDKQLVEMNQRSMIQYHTAIDVPILSQYPSVHSVTHIPSGYTYISGCNGLLPNYYKYVKEDKMDSVGDLVSQNTTTAQIHSNRTSMSSLDQDQDQDKSIQLDNVGTAEIKNLSNPTEFITPTVYDLLLIKLMFHEHIFQEVLDIIEHNKPIYTNNEIILTQIIKKGPANSIKLNTLPPQDSSITSSPDYNLQNSLNSHSSSSLLPTVQSATALSHTLFTTTFPPLHPSSLVKYAPELHQRMQQRAKEYQQMHNLDINKYDSLNSPDTTNTIDSSSHSHFPPVNHLNSNQDIDDFLNPLYLYTQLLHDYTQAYLETKQSILNLLSISIHSGLNIFTAWVKLTIYTTSTKFLPFIKYAFQIYWPHHPINSSPTDLFSLSIVPVLQLRYDAMVEIDTVAVKHSLNKSFLFNYIFQNPPKHFSVLNQIFSRLILQSIYPDEYTKDHAGIIPMHQNPTLAKMSHMFERYHKHITIHHRKTQQHLFKLDDISTSSKDDSKRGSKNGTTQDLKRVMDKKGVKKAATAQKVLDLGKGTGQTYQPLSTHPMVNMALQKKQEIDQEDFAEFEASQQTESFLIQYSNYTYIQLLRQATTLEILPDEYIYTPIYHNPMYIYEKQIEKKGDAAHTKDVIDQVITANPELVAQPEKYDRFDDFDINRIVRGPLDDKITAAMIEKKSLKLTLKEVQYKNQLDAANAFRYTIVPTTSIQKQTLYHLTDGLYPSTIQKPINPFTPTVSSIFHSVFIQPLLSTIVGYYASQSSLLSSMFSQNSQQTITTRLTPFLSLLETLPHLATNSATCNILDLTSTTSTPPSAQDETTANSYNVQNSQQLERKFEEYGPNKHLHKFLNNSIFYHSLQKLILATVSRIQQHTAPLQSKNLSTLIFGPTLPLDEKWYNFKSDHQYYVPQQMYVHDEIKMLQKQRIEEEQIQLCLINDLITLETEVKPILPSFNDLNNYRDYHEDDNIQEGENNDNNDTLNSSNQSTDSQPRSLKDFIKTPAEVLIDRKKIQERRKIAAEKAKKKEIRRRKKLPKSQQERVLSQRAAEAGFSTGSNSDDDTNSSGLLSSIFGSHEQSTAETQPTEFFSHSLPESHPTHFDLYSKEHGFPCSPFTAVTIEDKLRYCLKYSGQISDQPTNGILYSRVGLTPGSIHSSAFIGNNYIQLYATIVRLLYLFKQAQNIQIVKIVFITSATSASNPDKLPLISSPYHITKLSPPTNKPLDKGQTTPTTTTSTRVGLFSSLWAPNPSKSINSSSSKHQSPQQYPRKGNRNRDCSGFLKLFQSYAGSHFPNSETSTSSFDQAYNSKMVKQKKILFGALYRRRQLPSVTTFSVPQLPNNAKYHIEIVAVFK